MKRARVYIAWNIYIYIYLLSTYASFEEVKFQWAGIMRNDSS